MRITMVLPGGGRSGGIKSTVKAANGLQRRGHQVRLLVNKKQLTIKDTLRKWYLDFRYSHGADWLGLFEGSVEYFSDLTDCHFSQNEILVASGGWAAKELKEVTNPGIIKVHHLRGIDGDDNRMRECWIENVPKIAVGSYINHEVHRLFNQKLYAVVHNGIETTEYFSVVPEQQRDGVGTILGCSWHKDPEAVLRVIGMLRDKRPALPIRVFGACKRARSLPAAMYTRLPPLEEAREIYSHSLVWFLGSRSEGFPAPVLEAMACGCAVVATDCGGPKDIIRDGVNGFLCEVGNVEQIVEKIGLLLEDEELRKRFVQESQKTIHEFTWEKSVDKLEKVLLEIYQANKR